MNIYDIAERAGVSVSTASRVLNNPPNVSAKSREKVRRVMREVGYTPNIFARGATLSSIDNRMDELCTAAVDIMMNVFDGRDAISRIMVSARFVERESFRL